jgi:hypothetical protein
LHDCANIFSSIKNNGENRHSYKNDQGRLLLTFFHPIIIIMTPPLNRILVNKKKWVDNLQSAMTVGYPFGAFQNGKQTFFEYCKKTQNFTLIF